MSDSLPKGVIFDMDGVIVDSEALILQAAIMMFAEHGIGVRPEDFMPFVGTGENHALGSIAKKYNFKIDIERDKKRTYEIYFELIKGRLRTLPGVDEFIARCRRMQKKIAIATSADMRKVEGNLGEVKMPFETFDAIITAEDVVHKKPAPDIFIAAAERLGLTPGECLVVEDAVSGVTAAKAAGAKCLAITSSFPEEKLAKADWLAPNLAAAPEEVLDWR
jgi:beta-phosphoglucomutase